MGRFAVLLVVDFGITLSFGVFSGPESMKLLGITHRNIPNVVERGVVGSSTFL